ncbi:MAG: glycosyl transferase [Rhodospirillaceae bacterium]|nr:glycosyl transferase [Rhodospirillaceae bacterium]
MVPIDPEFTVIVVTHNSGSYLARCLDALENQTFREFEILIIDNNSTDGSLDLLSTDCSSCRLIRAIGNLGFAAANNLAAREGRGRWLVLLNPDAFAEPDWLSEIIAAIKRYPGAVMFGSTQIRASEPGVLDGAGDHYHPLGLAWRGGEGEAVECVDQDAEVFGPCGAAAVYERTAFLRHGGFDERLFCYYEDVDLALRMRLAGEVCIQLAGAKVRHVGSGSTGAGSDFIRYHISRNRLWVFIRGMPGPLFFVLLPALVAGVIARLAVSVFTGDFELRVRALRDALSVMPQIWLERRNLQNHREIAVMAFARALTWSVGKLILRARDPRPISPIALSNRDTSNV